MSNTFQCTLCGYNVYGEIKTYDSLEAIEDHMAMHSLKSLGKLQGGHNNVFVCTECLFTNITLGPTHLTSYASAIHHLNMHEQLKKESKALFDFTNIGQYSRILEIHDSQVLCLNCYIKRRLMNMDAGIFEFDYGKNMFDSIPEFFQHYMSEHLQTPPMLIPNSLDVNKSFLRHHCSFCGRADINELHHDHNIISWWDKHKSECTNAYEKIQQEITTKKAIATLILCYKSIKNTRNTESLLSSIDDHIIKKIIRFMT